MRALPNAEAVCLQLMLVPVVLACVWWGRHGVVVAAATAVAAILLRSLGIVREDLGVMLATLGMLLLAAMTTGWLRTRLDAGREAAARSESIARALLRDSPLGVLVHADGRVVFANERLCRLLGWESPQIIGAPIESLVRAGDAGMLSADASQPELPRELQLLRRDGSAVWVEAAGSRIQFESREAEQVSVTDVSARREAEAQRRELTELARRQEEQLEHSSRLAELGEMAAAISHELNQPLTGIRNYARNAYYMIEQKAGAESDVKANLRLISEQVDRAAKIINQMRELTRRSDNVSALLDLNSVIRECVEFLMPQMKLSEVAVSLALAADLPGIWGDRIRLAQVFLNLLSNARQAMEGAPVRRLSVISRRDDASSLPAVVEVTDTGRGFTEEQARRLFQPFYTTRKGGHGLGLSISRAIVQDHAGVIEAAGVPEAGATFTLRLPAARRES